MSRVPADASPDSAPLPARSAFDVRIKLTNDPSKEHSWPRFDLPDLAATLAVDVGTGSLVLGAEGHGSAAAIRRAGEALEIVAPFTVVVRFQQGCDQIGYLRFDRLRILRESSGRLSGTGVGVFSYDAADLHLEQWITASLDGTTDSTAPTLSIGDTRSLDPMVPARFAASEPLPLGTKAQLVSSDGRVVDLIAETPQEGMPVLITGFRVPSVLPFGVDYHLNLDQVVDFGGHRAGPAPGPPLFSLASPPLLTDGGFESIPNQTFGDARVFSAGALPVITGTSSLFLEPGRGFPGTLTLRMDVHPGDSSLRFSYRVTARTLAPSDFVGLVAIGSVGSKVSSLRRLRGDLPVAMAPGAGDFTWMISPVFTAELPLPDPNASEVVLRIATVGIGCDVDSMMWPSGLIIDDLRLAR